MLHLGGLQSKERAGSTTRKVSTLHSCDHYWAEGPHGLNLSEASCAGEGALGAPGSHLITAFRATPQVGEQGQDGIRPISSDVVKGVSVYNRGAQPTLEVWVWPGRFHKVVVAASFERH